MPFSPERADEFLTRLEGGEGIHSICDDEHMPAWATICRWKREFPDFATRYSRARESSAESCEHNAIYEAGTAIDKDTAAAAKVRSDVWKWAAAVRNPKTHGDRIDATVTFTNGLADRLNAAMQRSGRVVDVEPEAIAGPDDESAKTG